MQGSFVKKRRLGNYAGSDKANSAVAQALRHYAGNLK